MLAALMSVALAAPAGAKYKNFSCVLVHGPGYTYTLPNSPAEMAFAYDIEGFGTTCGFAKKWVRRLAKEPCSGGTVKKRRSHPPVLRHGPPGWRCVSTFIAPSLHPVTAYEGNCQNRKDLRRVFQWQDNIGYADPIPVDPPTVAPSTPDEP